MIAQPANGDVDPLGRLLLLPLALLLVFGDPHRRE
jgi:hypothetical protein